MSVTIEHDVALFIDWDNLAIGLDERERNRDLRPHLLLSFASEFGRPVLRRAYADWRGRWQQWMREVTDAGIQLVHVPLGSTQKSEPGKKGKSSVDVKLAVDAIECAVTYPNIHTFVLVTSDGDFIHLVHALQSHGRRVIALGIRESTNERFTEAVDLMRYYHDLLPSEEMVEQQLRRIVELVALNGTQHPFLTPGRLRQELYQQGQFGGWPDVRALVEQAEERGLLKSYQHDLRGSSVRAVRLARSHPLVVEVLGVEAGPSTAATHAVQPPAEVPALPVPAGAPELVDEARQLLGNGGSVEQVKQLLNRAQQLDPAYYGSYYVMADLAFRMQHYERAAVFLRAAIARCTDTAQAQRLASQLSKLEARLQLRSGA